MPNSLVIAVSLTAFIRRLFHILRQFAQHLGPAYEIGGRRPVEPQGHVATDLADRVVHFVEIDETLMAQSSPGGSAPRAQATSI